MVKRLSRKINSENVWKMLNWNHFLFQQRLKHKAEEIGCHVFEVSEHYTSKTCGQCGKVHWKLGSNKVFKCPYCQFQLGQDFNGARNIFLMNVEKSIGTVSKMNPSLEGGCYSPQTTSL
jgi:putative transposase